MYNLFNCIQDHTAERGIKMQRYNAYRHVFRQVKYLNIKTFQHQLDKTKSLVNYVNILLFYTVYITVSHDKLSYELRSYEVMNFTLK